MVILLSILFHFSFFAALRHFKFALFMFLVTLPLNYIFQEQYLLLPIPFHSGYAICILFHFFYHGDFRLQGLSQDNYKLIMIVKKIFLLILFIIIYRKLKQVILFDVSYWDFIKTIINKLLLTFTSYFLAIYFIKNKEIFSTVKSAIVISAILIIISMSLSSLLSGLGFSMYETADQGFEAGNRFAGFYYGGDVNSVGVFLNFVVALILFTLKNGVLKIKSIILVLILSIGIAITGSRAALIILIMILSIYAITNSILVFNPGVLVGVIFLALSLWFITAYYGAFSNTLSRLQSQGVMPELDPNQGTGTRFLRWFMFIDYAFSSWFRLLFGNDSILYTNNLLKYRDVHNHFIHVLYFNGIIFLFFYLYYIIKLQIVVCRNNSIVVAMVLLFPFLLGGMFISNIKEISTYIMISPLLMTKMSKV